MWETPPSAQTGSTEGPGMARPGRLALLPCFLRVGSPASVSSRWPAVHPEGAESSQSLWRAVYSERTSPSFPSCWCCWGDLGHAGECLLMPQSSRSWWLSPRWQRRRGRRVSPVLFSPFRGAVQANRRYVAV